MDMTTDPLLSVKDLSIAFAVGGRQVLAVDRISFSIKKGETLALVGESGSGKSATALSIMKLLPYPAASHPSGTVTFKGQELLGLPEPQIRHIRGDDITIIFQEPMTSLNPLHTIERQGGAGAHHRSADPGRHPQSRHATEKLSAPALRRPAPARDDCHGACQRA